MRESKSHHYIVYGKGHFPNGYKRARVVGGGGPGKPISEIMSSGALQSQEEKAIHYNTLNAIRVRRGKHLSKGSLGHYRQKDSGEIAEDLVSICEQVKK